MSAIRILSRKPFIETMFGSQGGHRGHLNPDHSQPRRPHKNEERRLAVPARGKVFQTLSNELATGKTLELHRVLYKQEPASPQALFASTRHQHD